MRDYIFEGPLRIGNDEAYGRFRTGVEGVWERDFSRLEAGVMGYVVFRCED